MGKLFWGSVLGCLLLASGCAGPRATSEDAVSDRLSSECSGGCGCEQHCALDQANCPFSESVCQVAFERCSQSCQTPVTLGAR